MKLLFWISFISIIGLNIFPNTNIEAISSKDFQFRLDYAIHLIAYMLVSILFLLWKNGIVKHTKFSNIALFIVSGILFSVLTEYIQKFIPGRTYNPVDLYFNIAGIVSGFVLVYLLYIMSSRRSASGKIR
jgi:VanZ family protein